MLAHRRFFLFFLLTVLACPALPVTAHAAATGYTIASYGVTVAGSTATARAVVRASTTTTAELTMCVRDASGGNQDFAHRKSVVLAPSGTAYSATRTFAPGTYVYAPCVRDGSGWHWLGGSKRFTIAPPSSSRILFEDDFTGAAGQSFDRSKWQDWSTCTFRPSAAYGNIKCGDNETLDGQGHLRIPATATSGSSLSTGTKFGYVYGEASAWMKMPAEDGYWPAFWSFNSNPDCCTDTTPVVGEIDTVEQYTTWDDLFHRGAHNWSGDTTWAGPDDNSLGGVDLTNSYHKYTSRVEPGKITFLFDDKPMGELKSTDGNGKPWAFGPDIMNPNWLILTLAVGGAGGQQPTPARPAVLLIDRVEVKSLS